MTRWLGAVLLTVAVSSAALAQGVSVNDSGLTARDLVETADREADLALQREKLSVEEQISEIEREQLAVLDAILDAQTSFDNTSITGMVASLESGSGDADRSRVELKPDWRRRGARDQRQTAELGRIRGKGEGGRCGQRPRKDPRSGRHCSSPS